jgi:hypothetical protein
MTVIVSNDALSKLRQEARSRRQAALMTEARRRPPAPKPTYEATKPQIKMIVSNWYTDEFGNRARIIKAHD